MSASLSVSVNGEPRVLDGPVTVLALVEGMGQGTKGIAVALNEELVPRSTWGEVALRPDDRLEVLVASQGG